VGADEGRRGQEITCFAEVELWNELKNQEC